MFIQKQRIILASQSPRRQQLLTEAGLKFEVITHDTDESYPKNLSFKHIPQYIAQQKAKAVKESLKLESDIIIAADTIVEIDRKILGKPTSKAEAIQFLQNLSGKKHHVISGICLLSVNLSYTFSVSTLVYFNPLSKKQIDFYVANYHPYDKAGGYAIQEWIGLTGIEKIAGCYFNVMGLPVSRLLIELKKFVNFQ